MPASLSEVDRRLAPPRRLQGVSATLLPYREGRIDWKAFAQHVARTHAAGLGVAVNMDTGFGDLLSEAEREAVLDAARDALGAGVPFHAGAYPDSGGDPLPGYHRAIEAIERRGAVPVVVQCRSMHDMPAAEKAAFYARILEPASRAVGFELGRMFALHGEIWDRETFARLLELPKLAGAKHSSLDRALELDRLATRDRLRPGFRIFTGNDLAIDMVRWGSDYLLGLSTFAPERFAERDRALADDDVAFLRRNDDLQHLGNVGFRAPVPAYKHAAAIFLQLTGRLERDEIHPKAPRRPASDRVLLFDCARRLGLLEDEERIHREHVAPWLAGDAGSA